MTCPGGCGALAYGAAGWGVSSSVVIPSLARSSCRSGGVGVLPAANGWMIFLLATSTLSSFVAGVGVAAAGSGGVTVGGGVGDGAGGRTGCIVRPLPGNGGALGGVAGGAGRVLGGITGAGGGGGGVGDGAGGVAGGVAGSAGAGVAGLSSGVSVLAIKSLTASETNLSSLAVLLVAVGDGRVVGGVAGVVCTLVSVAGALGVAGGVLSDGGVLTGMDNFGMVLEVSAGGVLGADVAAGSAGGAVTGTGAVVVVSLGVAGGAATGIDAVWVGAEGAAACCCSAAAAAA